MAKSKFTDEEVIKALAELEEMSDLTPPICYHEKGVTEPPFCKPFEQYQRYTKIALDLINRQRAEIERLQKKTASQNNVNFKTGDCAKIVSNVSGHEFKIGTIVKLERDDDDYKAYANGDFWWVADDELEEIDDPEKEMTESKSCTEGADCFAAEGKE